MKYYIPHPNPTVTFSVLGLGRLVIHKKILLFKPAKLLTSVLPCGNEFHRLIVVQKGHFFLSALNLPPSGLIETPFVLQLRAIARRLAPCFVLPIEVNCWDRVSRQGAFG